MLGIFSKIFGGNKSEKDIKHILPLVDEINQHFSTCQSLSNDELRGKTQEFKARINEHLSPINNEIAELGAKAEALPFNEIQGRMSFTRRSMALRRSGMSGSRRCWRRFCRKR